MTPAFSDPAARRLWDDYFAEVDRLLAQADAHAADLCDDLAMHLADSMAAMPSGNERDRLNAALARLGRPVEYLRLLLADELIERGTRTYSPLTIAQGLAHAVKAGSRRMIIALAFGIGYLLLVIFTAIAFAKPLWAGHVGLFRYQDGTVSAGIVARTSGAHELLGWWSIPIAVMLAALLYGVLTNGLRAVHHRQ
jgi:hypothetical protein